MQNEQVAVEQNDLDDLRKALEAITVEEGCTIFEHTAEEIGLLVMENHEAVLAALTARAARHRTRALEASQAEAVAGWHVEALRHIKKTLPDYEGRAPKAVHYQRLHAALDAAIAALTPPQAADSGLLEEALQALKLARPIIDGDLDQAKGYADGDWIGMSTEALERIDAVLAKAGKPGEAGNG